MASILLASHDFCMQSGRSASLLISICALTSPAHTDIYEGTANMLTNVLSLHLVGKADTVDAQHMSGRTAGLFDSSSGI